MSAVLGAVVVIVDLLLSLPSLVLVSVVCWICYCRYRRLLHHREVREEYCDVCNMWLNSQEQYEEHLRGKKHKTNDPFRTRRPRRQAGQRSRLWGLGAETQPDNEEDWLCFVSDCEDCEDCEEVPMSVFPASGGEP